MGFFYCQNQIFLSKGGKILKNQDVKQKKFPVVIQEVLEKIVSVKATSELEALGKAQELYDKGAIVLDSNYLTQSQIFVDNDLDAGINNEVLS